MNTYICTLKNKNVESLFGNLLFFIRLYYRPISIVVYRGNLLFNRSTSFLSLSGYAIIYLNKYPLWDVLVFLVLLVQILIIFLFIWI